MRSLLFLLLSVLLLIQPCYAFEHIDDLYPENDILQLRDILSEDLRSLLDKYDIKTGQGVDSVFQGLKTMILQTASDAFQNLWRPALSVLMVIILCCIPEPFLTNDKKAFPLLLFGSVEILYLTLSDAGTFFLEAVDAVKRLYDFSTVLLPCLAGASVAAGASISAGVKYTAAALFMNILLNISGTVLIPIISIYLICVIGNTVFQQRILGGLSDLIRWAAKTVLTWFTVIFTAYLNIAGLITSTGDVFASRITKSTISAVLPVVGNILSNTASSLVAGAAILRNSIGIFGLLSVLGILLIPFVRLGIQYFLFLAVGRLAALFPDRRFSDLLGGIAGAFGMLLGVIGTGFIMIFLTLISFMQIVGG